MNILQPHTFNYLIGILGGSLLILGSSTKWYRNGSPILRTTLWFGSSLAVGWGILGLTYWFEYYHLSQGVRARISQTKTWCSGGALALLILLLTSKEFWSIASFAQSQRKAISKQPPINPVPDL